MENIKNNELWYALQYYGDSDADYGSHDYDEAYKMAVQGNYDIIAVYTLGDDGDWYCEKEIKVEDEYDDENKTKVCMQCGRELPLTQYSPNAQQKDGYHCYCKKCQKERVKQSQKKKKYTDVIGWRASQMVYQANNGAEKKLKTAEVRDMLLQHLMDTDGCCPRCGKTYNLVAKDVANQSTVSIDHIKPKSKGGENVVENIQFLCMNCNERKHAKWTES